MSGRIVRRIVYPVGEDIKHALTPHAIDGTSFTSELFRLMAKADPQNFQRLAIGFPVYAAAFVAWSQDPDGRLPDQVELEIRDDLRWAFIPGSPVIGL